MPSLASLTQVTRAPAADRLSAMPLDPSSILLTDRVALVTGAAVGIGEAIALTLARFGADLAICDRDQENLASTALAIEGTGRRTVCEVLDVRAVIT